MEDREINSLEALELQDWTEEDIYEISDLLVSLYNGD